MPRYVGQSWFVHWWPWFMVVFGLVQVLTDKRFAGYAILFALCGIAFALLLPWRFVVVDEGIGLVVHLRAPAVPPEVGDHRARGPRFTGGVSRREPAFRLPVE